MKISIIGYSGSGKSTSAKKLGELYNIPVLHLDTVQFLKNWQERPVEESQKIVSDFMTENESWVIDGNYSAFLQKERFEQADLILFFDFPRRVCFPRAFKRFLKFKGKSRPDMTSGCNEKFDFQFAKWILVDGRAKKYRDKYENNMKIYAEKAVRLKNQKQADDLFQNLFSKISE